MTVKNKEEAWRIAKLIFPGDFMMDMQSSLNSGYPIYKSCDVEEFEKYAPRICDLNDRLEVVLNDADFFGTVNIWIVEAAPTDKNELIAECKEYFGQQILDEKIDPFSTSIFFVIGAHYPALTIDDVLNIVDGFREDQIKRLQAIIDNDNKEDK